MHTSFAVTLKMSTFSRLVQVGVARLSSFRVRAYTETYNSTPRSGCPRAIQGGKNAAALHQTSVCSESHHHRCSSNDGARIPVPCGLGMQHRASFPVHVRPDLVDSQRCAACKTLVEDLERSNRAVTCGMKNAGSMGKKEVSPKGA